MSMTCDFAYINQSETYIKNLENTMTYENDRYNAFKNYKLTEVNRNRIINDEIDKIYKFYDEGYYVKNSYTVSNIPDAPGFFYTYYVDDTGNLLNCRASSGCSDLGTKCCSCNKYSTCSSCVKNVSCNNRLNVNLFQTEIDNLVAKVPQEVDNRINSLKFIYDNVPKPIIRPIPNIGCCQSITFKGISANNISIDTNQICKIINDKI